MGEIVRRPQARDDLVDIWTYIADDNELAADRLLERIDDILTMLSERRQAGRARPELGEEIRSFPVGNYVVFYKPNEAGIELVRVLSRYRDIGEDEFT